MQKIPQPRNTLVLVRELKTAEERVGSIVMPEMNGHNYITAEIVAFGPGMATNGRDQTEMHDLRPGQRVWLKAYTQQQRGGQVLRFPNGVETKVNGELLWLFEQTEIMMILDQPGEWDRPQPPAPETDEQEPDDRERLIIV